MICFEIVINGVFLCRAGIENATVISPCLSMFSNSEKPAYLRLSAISEHPDGSRIHVYWFEEVELSPGDEVSFTMLESSVPTKPSRITLLAAIDYQDGMGLLKELEKAQLPQFFWTKEMWSATALQCNVNGEQKFVIGAMAGDEYISCSLIWSDKNPDCYRIFTRSFCSKSDCTHDRKWLRSELSINDTLSLRIIA